ncbi:MAG: indole-3-glycerol phosphate synthase TrpC [Deltaproteobacteria bacterium]|nr:indole-3-glycerol phosphate synthase TrpC [Deltaproteobacteria bacterium]
MLLDDIIKGKEEELKKSKLYFPVERLKEKIKEAYPPRDFAKAISSSRDIEDIRIIAEVKRASPSKGVLRTPFFPMEIAKEYQLNGASAISVITEEKFFLGRLDFLVPIRLHLKLPVLRKDFLFEPYQVYESRASNADAILLIASILGLDKLKEMLELSTSLGMASLVEVHDEKELETAVEAGAKIIAINNRDLKTFEVDIKTTLRLAPMAPADALIVSESGISTLDDVIALRKAGVHAMLVGETLLTDKNPGRKLKELRGLV